jgi:hypothetical protein|tara:strand:+ start:165 stop:479 length:315 start_codon:yes stop_codon:yes gene_type:complete
MKNDVIREIYDALIAHHIVGNESEFSKDWLNRSECYLRTLRFKSAEPSIGTLAICASKLHYYGKRMMLTTTYKDLGVRFIELSDQCHQQINVNAELTWMGDKES